MLTYFTAHVYVQTVLSPRGVGDGRGGAVGEGWKKKLEKEEEGEFSSEG